MQTGGGNFGPAASSRLPANRPAGFGTVATSNAAVCLSQTLPQIQNSSCGVYRNPGYEIQPRLNHFPGNAAIQSHGIRSHHMLSMGQRIPNPNVNAAFMQQQSMQFGMNPSQQHYMVPVQQTLPRTFVMSHTGVGRPSISQTNPEQLTARGQGMSFPPGMAVVSNQQQIIENQIYQRQSQGFQNHFVNTAGNFR